MRCLRVCISRTLEGLAGLVTQGELQGASVGSNVSLSGCILSPGSVVEDNVSAIDLVLGDNECLNKDDIRIL